jgi:hypothetical protein
MQICLQSLLLLQKLYSLAKFNHGSFIDYKLPLVVPMIIFIKYATENVIFQQTLQFSCTVTIINTKLYYFTGIYFS